MEKELHVCISKANAKMGLISSVSLPPLKTCSPDACKTCGQQRCYAVKLCKLRKILRESYERNLTILLTDKEKFWREVEAAIMAVTVFRYSVAGDIYDMDYLEHMVALAEKYPHCQVITFTKKFDICNEWLSKHDYAFPQNLHVIFSAWKGLAMSNPYDMPKCHVIFKDGTITASEYKPSYYCSGNCFECFKAGRNCFNLKKGEQILIREH